MSRIIKSGFALFCLTISACATQPGGETPAAIGTEPGTSVVINKESADPGLEAVAELPKNDNGAQGLTDAEIWRIDSNDNYTHIQSGFICPKVWSGFVRNDVKIYQRSGNDVGCNYMDANGSVVTLYAYAYANLPSLDEELNAIMQNIVMVRHPVFEDADVIIRSDPSPQRFGYVGDAIIVTGTDGNQIKTGVFLSDAGPWRMKARVTYPAQQAELVETFVAVSLQGQWDRVVRQLSEDTTEDADSLPVMPSENEIDI